jgi:RNA polymerase sigma factor (sigma-70 family)
MEDVEADAAIRAAVKRRDETGAIRLLVRQYGGRLLALARTLVGAKDADDVLQEAAIAVILVLRADGEGIRSVRAYAFTAVRNKAYDHQKSVEARVLRRASEPDDATPAPPDSRPWWKTLAADQVAEALMARLSPRERVVMNLVREGCSYDDIGTQLGIAGKSARNIRDRAVERLRAWAAEEHGGPPSSSSPGTTG